MAENEKLQIGRKACISAGVNIVTSFDQGIAESELLNEMYDEIVDSEISLYYWRFAKATADLGSPLNETPDNTRFNNVYQEPNLLVAVNTVMVGGIPIEYERAGGKIYTTDTQNDTVVIEYRYRADESLWPPYFRLLIINRLAALLALSIARKTDVAEKMDEQAEIHWRRAKAHDSQGQTNKKLAVGRLRRVRGGGRLDKFWRDR